MSNGTMNGADPFDKTTTTAAVATTATTTTTTTETATATATTTTQTSRLLPGAISKFHFLHFGSHEEAF